MYDRAQAYPGPDPGLPETVRRSRRVKQQQQYQRQLWAICKPHLGSDAPMRVLCQRVERFLPELFTFVAEPRASADNQRSGTEPAPPVVSRKISGGTAFGAGSETKSILASLFGTWRLQERNPYLRSTVHPLQTPICPTLNSYLHGLAPLRGLRHFQLHGLAPLRGLRHFQLHGLAPLRECLRWHPYGTAAKRSETITTSLGQQVGRDRNGIR